MPNLNDLAKSSGLAGQRLKRLRDHLAKIQADVAEHPPQEQAAVVLFQALGRIAALEVQMEDVLLGVDALRGDETASIGLDDAKRTLDYWIQTRRARADNESLGDELRGQEASAAAALEAFRRYLFGDPES